MFDGSTKTFEMIKRPDSVRIIGVKNDKIVITEQEQPNRGLFYDLPGGIHDNENETELQAAQRELLEETGLVFKSWKLINVVQKSSNIERFTYIFLATDFDRQEDQQLDSGEKITVKYLYLPDAKDILSSPKSRAYPDEIKNASSIEELINLPAYR